MAEVPVTDARRAELEALLKLGVEIVTEERHITWSSNVDRIGAHAGKVTDFDARRTIARYDRFLKRAKKVLA